MYKHIEKSHKVKKTIIPSEHHNELIYNKIKLIMQFSTPKFILKDEA